MQTILSTSLPTIVSELEASQDQYTWVAVAYMLTQTAGQPLYGKFSDLIGRKVGDSKMFRTICTEYRRRRWSSIQACPYFLLVLF